MAFTGPAYVLDGSPVVDGLILPVFVLDGSPLVDGLTLPAFVLDASPLVDGLTLPPFYLTEAAPLLFSLAGTGGILFSGVANVFGDPYVATGGMLFSGEAGVSSVDVTISYVFPLGGIKYTGTATVATNFTVHSPSGGIQYSGTAAVTSVSILTYEHAVTGGILYSGEAKEPVLLFKPSGGILYSGAAEIESIRIYPHTAAGGMLYSGEATLQAVLTYTPSGGIIYAGTATVTVKQPVFVPSGGILYSGEAVSIFVGSTQILTPENPYADLFSGWALNYKTNAASRYEDLPMNSICTFKGVTYVANAGGIYKLEKTDDAGQPISASATVLSNTDFGTRKNKRVPYVYLGYESAYNLRMSVVTNKHAVFYQDVFPPSDKNRGARITLGRGLRGLYWTFRISNIDGAFFEIDKMHVDSVSLNSMGV